MSVQYEFVFGGGHDGASIPNQCFEGAAVDPQVIDGQNSFADWVQQARTAALVRGRGNPPPSSRTCNLTCLCPHKSD